MKRIKSEAEFLNDSDDEWAVLECVACPSPRVIKARSNAELARRPVLSDVEQEDPVLALFGGMCRMAVQDIQVLEDHKKENTKPTPQEALAARNAELWLEDEGEGVLKFSDFCRALGVSPYSMAERIRSMVRYAS